MKTSRTSKVFAGRSIADLEALAADLNQEFVSDKFRPLTATDRRLWNRAKRRPGRPRIGKGAQVVSVSIERSLLEQADRLARKRKITRARLIAEGLESILARSHKPRPGKTRHKAA